MRACRLALATVVVGFLAAGCGGGPSAPAPANKAASGQQPVVAKAAAPRPAAPAVMPRTPEPGPPLPPLAYDAKGRRDPFAPLQVVKEKAGLEVGTVKLVGVVTGSKPLALVEAPDGLGYILKSGDLLGNGRVTEVTANSVTFGVSGRGGERDTSLTLRLTKD